MPDSVNYLLQIIQSKACPNADCMLGGGLILFAFGFLVLISWDATKELAKQVYQQHRLGLAVTMILIVEAIVFYDRIAIIFVAICFLAWLFLASQLSNWRMQLRGFSIGMQNLAVILIPFAYAAVWLSEVAYQKWHSRPISPAVLLALGSSSASELELKRVVGQVRDNITGNLDNSLAVIPDSSLIDAKFSSFKQLYGWDWDLWPAHISDIPDAIGRRITFVRHSVMTQPLANQKSSFQILAELRTFDPAERQFGTSRFTQTTGLQDNEVLLTLILSYRVMQLLPFGTRSELQQAICHRYRAKLQAADVFLRAANQDIIPLLEERQGDDCNTYVERIVPIYENALKKISSELAESARRNLATSEKSVEINRGPRE